MDVLEGDARDGEGEGLNPDRFEKPDQLNRRRVQVVSTKFERKKLSIG